MQDGDERDESDRRCIKPLRILTLSTRCSRLAPGHMQEKWVGDIWKDGKGHERDAGCLYCKTARREFLKGRG